MVDDLNDIFEDDELSSLFNDTNPDNSNTGNGGDEFSFLEDTGDGNDSLLDDEDDAFFDSLFSDTGDESDETDDLLAALFAEDESDTEEDYDGKVDGEVLGESTAKPKPAMAFLEEKRKARLDITKNSKEDHRTIVRFTKTELAEQIRDDYKYMLGKSKMVIQPLTVIGGYPFKKKKSDSDIIREDGKNVDYGYAMVIGKLLKWRNTDEFRKKPYRLGKIMYVRRGVYWVNGKTMSLQPHFAIIIHKSNKRIKSKRIRDLLDPVKQRLRPGKPYSFYKEFPIIVKRTGVYS